VVVTLRRLIPLVDDKIGNLIGLDMENSKLSRKRRKPKKMVLKPPTIIRAKKPSTSTRKKGRGQRKHIVSGMYNYPTMQNDRKFMKKQANDEASYDIDPFADQGFPQGQERIDEATFKILASGCSTFKDYSNLVGQSAKRIVWREPLTYKNTSTGAVKLDSRGTLIDVMKVELQFKNLIHGAVRLKGNMPKCTFEEPSLIATRPNPFDIELNPIGDAGSVKSVPMHIGNKVLKFRQLEFPLPDPAAPTFKQLWMAIVDFTTSLPNVDEFDGEPYDANKEVVAVVVKIHYITTMAAIEGSDGFDPAVTQMINSQPLAVQNMGPEFNVFHIDPLLIPTVRGFPDLVKTGTEWAPVKSVGQMAGGPRYGDYRAMGAKGIFDTVDKFLNAVERVVSVVSLVSSFFL